MIGVLSLLSLISYLTPLFKKETQVQSLSLDTLVPKGFVLVPIDILNGKDLLNLIGSYGVVDLYAYSQSSDLPKEQIAQLIKILPPNVENGLFTALIPAKEVHKLFEYSPPFYAVVQNPQKQGSQIHKKKIRQSLQIIEENF